jgi:His-Xaa-Ser system protein HxsD
MKDELVVEFDQTIHSIDALNAAAYRLIGIASCRIERAGGKYVCHLSPDPTSTDPVGIRSHFVNLVTDEQLRERLASETEPVRNLIISLAFASLASQGD